MFSIKRQAVNSFHFPSHKDFVENSHTQYSNQWPGLCSRQASVRNRCWDDLGLQSTGCWAVTSKIKPILCLTSQCLTSKQQSFPKACTSLLPSPTLFYLLCPRKSTSHGQKWRRSQVTPLTILHEWPSKSKSGRGLPQTAQPRPYFHRLLFKLSLFGFRGSI